MSWLSSRFHRNPSKASTQGGPDPATLAAAMSELLAAGAGDRMRQVLERRQKVLLTDNAIAAVVGFALKLRHENPQQAGMTLLIAELLDRARRSGIEAAFRRPPVDRQLFETQDRWMLLEGNLPAQRRFLEEHLELLSYSSLAQLQRTLTFAQQVPVEQNPYTKSALELRGALNRLWLLLFDARQRGGDVQAIRDAYVNWHGGFALDIPVWLAPIIERDTALQHSGQRSQTARQRIALWEEALERAHHEPAGLVPEVQAEMYVRAQEAYEDARGLDKAELQKKELACILSSLNTYTEARYPYAWAGRQARLGALYLNYLQGDRAENIEKAIACLQATLRIWTKQDFPLEWAQTHNYLGWAYRDRLQGNREENQEQSLLLFEAALRVLNERNAPIDWAMVQSNLGVLYIERLREQKAQNLRSAITCLRAALQVFTEETAPVEWAMTLMELGNVLTLYSEGDPDEKRQQAMACFQAALRVYTEESFPLEWAMTQTNLGNLYTIQAGIASENSSRDQEEAIAHYEASIRVFTEHDFPVEWARSQLNLGTVYSQRQQGDVQENRKQAMACFQAALQVYTRQAFPELHRSTALNLAVCAGEQRLWELVRSASASARAAEDDLIALAAGVKEVDTILRGQDQATVYEAFALTRLERYTEAIEVAERGRTRGLAAARLLNAADPQRISDPARRERYLSQRAALLEAQAAVQQATGRPSREEWLARVSRLRQVRAAFDDTIAAIRAAGDPADFLRDDFSSETFLRLLAEKPAGYALIYLLATPWGGLAPGVLGTHPQRRTSPCFTALDLPELTLEALHREELSQDRESYLKMVFNRHLLGSEGGLRLDWLAGAALRPLAAWLQQEGITSMTLIPCGILAAFPLLTVPLEIADGEPVTLADRCTASLAPGARVLLDDAPVQGQRHGVATLGNPYPTHQSLPWGEAEALTLAHLGGDPSRAAIQYEADRAHLLEILRTAQVVDVSSHGIAANDYLQSRLLLANGESLTLADALNETITAMHGLRLLILSACQTAIFGLAGAPDEVRSLAAGMLQAGAKAVLASLWPVDDRATYLLIVRFAQEWFPHLESEPPAAALARAQRWLRSITYRELQDWQATEPLPGIIATSGSHTPTHTAARTRDAAFSPGRGMFSPDSGEQSDPVFSQRYSMQDAEQILQEVAHRQAQERNADERPYASPFYWAGFQLYGW